MDTHRAAGPAPATDAVPSYLHYRMTGDAEPGLLPRVLEVFAKRNLVPDTMRAERRDGGDGLSIELRIAPIEPAKARHIAVCLRGTVGVRTVLGPVTLETG